MPDRRDAARKHPSCQRSIFRTNAHTFGQALRCVRVTSLRVWLQRSAWPTAQLTAPRQCLIHTNPARCMCHFDSPGLPPQCLVELQFRDWLSAQVRMRASTVHALLRPPGLLSGQTTAGCFYARANSGVPGAEITISDAPRPTLNRGEIGTFGLPAWNDFARNFVLWQTNRQKASPNAFKFTIRQQWLCW